MFLYKMFLYISTFNDHCDNLVFWWLLLLTLTSFTHLITLYSAYPSSEYILITVTIIVVLDLLWCVLGKSRVKLLFGNIFSFVALRWNVDRYLVVSMNVSPCVADMLVVQIGLVAVIVTWRPFSLSATAMRKVSHPPMSIWRVIFRSFVYGLYTWQVKYINHTQNSCAICVVYICHLPWLQHLQSRRPSV